MNTPENELLLSDAFPQISLYTPVSREEWERNQVMYDALLEYVLGDVELQTNLSKPEQVN